MILIILFVILPLISILIAVFSDKIRDKFFFDKDFNEEILEVEVDVEFLQKNETKEYKKGLIYLTNKRIIFFKYKYGWLEIIPILGGSLVAVFIDKNTFWQLPIADLSTYHFEGKIVQNQNHTTLLTHGYTTFITKNNEFFKFDIQLDLITKQKSKWLVNLDKLLPQPNNPNY